MAGSPDVTRGAPALADELIIITSNNHLNRTVKMPALGVVCLKGTRLDGRATASLSGRPITRGSQAANALAHIGVWIS